MINEINNSQLAVSKETIITNLLIIIDESDNLEQFNQLISEDEINFIMKDLTDGQLTSQYMELGEFLNDSHTIASGNAHELSKILHRYLCVIHSYHNWLQAEEELVNEHKIDEQQWPAILIGDFAKYDKVNFLSKFVSYTQEERLQGVRLLLNNLQIDYENPQIIEKQYIKDFIEKHKGVILKAEYYNEVLLGKAFAEEAVKEHTESWPSARTL